MVGQEAELTLRCLIPELHHTEEAFVLRGGGGGATQFRVTPDNSRVADGGGYGGGHSLVSVNGEFATSFSVWSQPIRPNDCGSLRFDPGGCRRASCIDAGAASEFGGPDDGVEV